MTILEDACESVMGDNYIEFYNIISNILLLNYKTIKRNDKRLSAKVTAILFNEKLQDKVHIISELINDSELNINYTQDDLKFTKLMLQKDPTLKNTIDIVQLLKEEASSQKLIEKLSLIDKSDLEKYILEAQIKYLQKY